MWRIKFRINNVLTFWLLAVKYLLLQWWLLEPRYGWYLWRSRCLFLESDPLVIYYWLRQFLEWPETNKLWVSLTIYISSSIRKKVYLNRSPSPLPGLTSNIVIWRSVILNLIRLEPTITCWVAETLITRSLELLIWCPHIWLLSLWFWAMPGIYPEEISTNSEKKYLCSFYLHWELRLLLFA